MSEPVLPFVEWSKKDGCGLDLQSLLTMIRGAGWMVVCHNDYRLNGVLMTFYGFSKGDRYVKGEGRTDIEALTIVAETIRQQRP